MAQLRFRQVRYFVEVVEDDFGVKLLHRHARGISPTETGQRFYRSARRVLDLLDESEAIIAGQGDAKRHFFFGMTPSFLHVVGVGALLPEPWNGNGIVARE